MFSVAFLRELLKNGMQVLLARDGGLQIFRI
jgi:hypothetical protein